MSFEIGFIIKKVVSAMIMPLPIGLILGSFGLWYLYRNHINRAKIFLTISLVWIATISYAPLSNTLLIPLENSVSRLKNIPHDVKYILILGGDKEQRGWEVLRLYHQIPNVKIITSGYSPYGGVSTAIQTARLLERSGVLKEDIIIQDKPKDTNEEVVAIKKLLGASPFILVTSAYHMPRAISLFQREGLNPIPAPTQFQIRDRDTILSVPKGKELLKTEQAWHEYLGLLWYSIRG